MIVESHYAIAIDKLSNWLKNLAPDFKPKPIVCCKSDIYCALRKLRVIIRNSDWFFSLFAPVVIGRSYYGGGDSYKQILTKNEVRQCMPVSYVFKVFLDLVLREGVIFNTGPMISLCPSPHGL